MSWKFRSTGKGENLLYSQAGIPSVDFRFGVNKSLIDHISGKNLINFARNGTATYVDSDKIIKIAETNQPRFGHDPVTGQSLGFLTEVSRTNLMSPSDQPFRVWL